MTIIMVISDTHIGSSVALSSDKFINSEGQEVSASKTQNWINDCWRDFVYYAKAQAEGNRLVVLHLGDVIEGIHHKSPQALQLLSDHKEMAISKLQPLRDIADAMYICKGTEVHAGLTGEFEKEVARALKAECDYSFCLQIDKVTIDIAHQGRCSGRDWTSLAAGVAAEVQLDYYRAGMAPPRYVLRGHSHRIDDSGDKIPGTRAIVCPAWQTKTAFGHKIGSLKRSDIGGLIIDTNAPEFVDFSRARYKAEETGKTMVIV